MSMENKLEICVDQLDSIPPQKITKFHEKLSTEKNGKYVLEKIPLDQTDSIPIAPITKSIFRQNKPASTYIFLLNSFFTTRNVEK